MVNTLSQIYLADLQELLFNGLEFINFSVNHDAFIGNSVVHVPQMAETIGVAVNPSGTTASHYRTDTDLTYNIDHYVTTPVEIEVKDETQTNYSLRESSVRAHANKLNENVGDLTAYKWAANFATASVILTTGATSSDALASSATGFRRKFLKEDFRKAAKALDKQKVSKNGRYALIPSDMYYELFDDSEVISFDYNNKKSLPDGVVTQLYGINILVRPTGVITDGSYDPLAPSAQGNATDNHAVLVWQEEYVGKAFDRAEVYMRLQDPSQFGASTLSAGVFYGAAALRTDGAGVVLISQTAV